MKKFEDRLASSKPIAPIGKHKNGQPVKVVVIDDTFIDRRIMTQILRSTGFDVVGEAIDGQEGLHMIEHEKPHLVILDYVMPKMNGNNVLKEITKRFPKTYVIMSTSESDRDIATELIKGGAKDYIVKPIDRKLVISKLKKAVDDLIQIAKNQDT